MTVKQLSTAACATLTTGICMVERFAGVGEAASWVMGHDVFTHELPMLGDTIRDRLLAQLPDLPATATSENFIAVRDAALARYGETVDVEQGETERTKSPLATLDSAMRAAKAKAR